MPLPRISPRELRQALSRMVDGGGPMVAGAAEGAAPGAMMGGMMSPEGERMSGMGRGALAGAGMGAAVGGAAQAGGLRGALNRRLTRMTAGPAGAAGVAGGMMAERMGGGDMSGGADEMAVGGARTMDEALSYLQQYLGPDELEVVATNARDVPEIPPILRQMGYSDQDFESWAMNAQQGGDGSSPGTAGGGGAPY